MALTWILLQLSERPDLQEKARQEIMSVLGEDVNKTPAHEDLNALKLTTAVIKETQRYDCINVHFNGIKIHVLYL